MREVHAKIRATRRVPQLRTVQARAVGGTIMAGSLVFAIWVTAAACDPGIVSSAAVDAGFNGGALRDGVRRYEPRTNERGVDGWACQTQTYDWKFRPRGAVTREAVSGSFAVSEKEVPVTADRCPAGTVGTFCALQWQYDRRERLDGVRNKPARSFSLLQGNICVEPVPYLYGLGDWPDSLFSRFYGVKTLKGTKHDFVVTGDALRGISRLVDLSELILPKQPIVTFPDEICDLEKLIHLDARHAGLATLPECVGKVGRRARLAAVLRLEGNALERLPLSIFKMDLSELLLEDNALVELPAFPYPDGPGVGPWPNLNKMYLDHNALIYLPDWIEHLASATIIDAGYVRESRNLRGVVAAAQEPGPSQVQRLPRPAAEGRRR